MKLQTDKANILGCEIAFELGNAGIPRSESALELGKAEIYSFESALELGKTDILSSESALEHVVEKCLGTELPIFLAPTVPSSIW